MELADFLMYALPSGFLSGLFTWLASRRKRNNDMLRELQSSINMLSEENRKILQENVQLRRENADLKSNQEEMIIRLSRLTKEVERLRKVINKQTGNEEKSNHVRTPTARNRAVRLCNTEAGKESKNNLTDNTEREYRSRRSNLAVDETENGRNLAGADDNSAGSARCTILAGDGENSDIQPP